MTEDTFSFTGKANIDMKRVFLTAYKNAFTKSVEMLYAETFKNAPVGKTKSGTVNLRNALFWDFDLSRGEGFVGIPKGSEMEKVAFYTEMGTGERGAHGWRVWFEEKRPEFTIPIVPINKKAMHFKNTRGQDVFMKSSKGQLPQSWMRRAFYDNKNKVTKIWKKEFSKNNIEKLFKMVEI